MFSTPVNEDFIKKEVKESKPQPTTPEPPAQADQTKTDDKQDKKPEEKLDTPKDKVEVNHVGKTTTGMKAKAAPKAKAKAGDQAKTKTQAKQVDKKGTKPAAKKTAKVAAKKAKAGTMSVSEAQKGKDEL